MKGSPTYSEKRTESVKELALEQHGYMFVLNNHLNRLGEAFCSVGEPYSIDKVKGGIMFLEAILPWIPDSRIGEDEEVKKIDHELGLLTNPRIRMSEEEKQAIRMRLTFTRHSRELKIMMKEALNMGILPKFKPLEKIIGKEVDA